MHLARVILFAFLSHIYFFVAFANAGSQDGAPVSHSKDSAQSTSPEYIQSQVLKYKELAEYNNEHRKNLVNMAKGRSGPATKREVDKYAERTVNRVQNKYTQMRREIYHGSLMRSQLVAENRHDEAKQVQRAVRKYTNSWGRHYGVLLAVENRNRDFDRPKQQLEMEKKDFQEATKTHRTYVGDPFYRKLLSEYTNDLLQDHKSNIDIEKERRQSVNKMMARLNLKGHRKEAKQLQQAHKQYSKVFGENYSLLKAVHMREEHPSQYWHRKGPKKGAERPRAKKPIDKPFPPLTTPKENLAHVPVKAEKGLGYTPSLYSGYEPPPPSGP